MSSVLTQSHGAFGTKTQLTRAGVGAVAVLISALLISSVLGWRIYMLTAEKHELLDVISAMEAKADRTKTAQPAQPGDEKAMALAQVLETSALQAQKVLDLNSEVLRLAAEMPEFKSAQYREPYQALLAKIQEVDSAVQMLKTETTE